MSSYLGELQKKQILKFCRDTYIYISTFIGKFLEKGFDSIHNVGLVYLANILNNILFQKVILQKSGLFAAAFFCVIASNFDRVGSNVHADSYFFLTCHVP